MRAMQVRENLEGLRHLGEEIDGRVREQLGEKVVIEIETAPSSKWLPLQLDVELSRLVYEHAGRKAFIEWSRSAILESAKSPLLSGFIRAGLRLFGGNPGSLIRLARRGYHQLFREAGTLEVKQLREDAVRVVGLELPALLVEEPTYLEGIGESIAVLPQFVRHEGSSKLHVDGDQVHWDISWRPLPS